MSEQTLKRIFGGLGILLILWLGSVWLSGRPSGGPEADGSVAMLFAGLSEATVDAVRIVGPAQTVTLERSGDTWSVNGYRADPSFLARFWTAVADAEVGGVVANNPNNHERMGLAGNGWTVEFTLTDGATESVMIGSGGQGASGGYARMPDEDDVVVVSGAFKPTASMPLSDWRDRSVVQLDTASVARLVFETEEGTLAAERSDTGWSVDGAPANSATIQAVLEELVNLLASGFGEEGAAFEENPKRVIAFAAGGATLADITVTGESAVRHARARGSDVVFELPSVRADRVAPDIASLGAPNSGGL